MFPILGSRRLTLPVFTTTSCLAKQMSNARPWMPVSDDLEGLEALTPNHFLLGRPVVEEPLMPDSAKYIECRKMYEVAE